MKTKRILMKLSILLSAAVAVSSCVTTRKIAYLQDMGHQSQIELENRFEAVISPYDELDIIISSYNSELAKPFNIYSAAEGSIRTGSQNIGYLVDQNGDIQLPVLGNIHVVGLTRLKLQEKIRDMLIRENFISDPYVMVRFKSFKIFFLGSDGGKAITIPNERCTFLEALALSGDLSIHTRKDKIAVLREVDGKMVMRYLDPRSSRVFDDPFFMLQQNDFIITRSSGYKNFLDSFNQLSPFLTLFSTVASIVSVILIYDLYESR